ncbi:hypothetical protein L1987_02430 [Smallanthus sonchifolius]|uniref:Uncharacterized protein n=1 Tax=Smallanthus sonchifolius TaxID=185202 RepID=A0ACB9K7Q8_9ASTR|nr:hypothetical protein L1987_02430 [Smallanthus sonchifolius]
MLLQSHEEDDEGLISMDIPNVNANNSDCELVSENEVVSKAKQKSQKQKKDGKPPAVSSIKPMALEMSTKYQRYWGDINKLNNFLFIVMVLDPRWKWQYIDFIVKEKFVGWSLKLSLDLNLRTLFELYTKSMPQKEKVVEASSSSANEVCGDQAMDIEQIMAKRFEMAMGSSEISSSKIESDKYLGESGNILIWRIGDYFGRIFKGKKS